MQIVDGGVRLTNTPGAFHEAAFIIEFDKRHYVQRGWLPAEAIDPCTTRSLRGRILVPLATKPMIASFGWAERCPLLRPGFPS